MSLGFRPPVPWLLVICSSLSFCVAACGNSEPSTPTAPSPTEGVSIGIMNEPCAAPATGPVSCQFTVLPETQRGNLQLQFGWRYTNPANSRAVAGGAAWSSQLPLDCTFSAGLARFEVVVTLFVTHLGLGTTGTVNRSVVVTRTPGDCGT